MFFTKYKSLNVLLLKIMSDMLDSTTKLFKFQRKGNADPDLFDVFSLYKVCKDKKNLHFDDC